MRQAAGQHFVAHRAQRVDVAARVGIARLPGQLLRAHVRQGAHDLPGLGHVGGGVALQAGDAEVQDLRLAALVDQHVRRLQVAVDDAALVGELRRARQLRQQADARAQVGLGLGQVLAQVGAADQLQREPRRRHPAHQVLARGVQPHDPGMLELAEDLDLAMEALQRPARHAAHHLERHVARRMRFAGQVDPAHPALAQQAEDAVRPDGLGQAGGGLRLFVQRLGGVVVLHQQLPLPDGAMLPAPV